MRLMKLLNVDTIQEVESKLAEYFKGHEAGIEEISLHEASGRYLAEDIIAGEDMPGFRRSVVDGYALKGADTFGISDTSPMFLSLVGEVEMGELPTFTLKSGQAAYIPTGGCLPEGSDGVVMVEYTELLDHKTVCVNRSVAPGEGFMEVGEDFKNGTLIYAQGHRITIKDVGMLAALGYGSLQVFAKPVAALISTGDELVSVFDEPGPGQVRDVNSYTLAALIETTGCSLGHVSLIGDMRNDLESALRQAYKSADFVLLSGGSSAGLKDMTAELIDGLGAPGVITHGVAMKPGKPTIIGVIEDTIDGATENYSCRPSPKLVAGLPGHPMAAILSYKIIIEPFIQRTYFKNEAEPLSILATLGENITGGEGRETFVFVKLEEAAGIPMAKPIHAKSASLSQLRGADGYVRINRLSEGAKSGTVVKVFLLA